MATRSSFLQLLLIMAVAVQLHHLHAQPSFDYPTAKLSTSWTNSANLPHTIQYPDGSTIKALLLRSPPEKYGASFACGFYCRSQGTGAACTNYHFAIFIVNSNSGAGITNVNIGIPQVVWVANRNRPVKENAVLQFAPDGNLLLKDADGTLVWSTNTAGKAVASLSITDAGNLVLANQKGATVWQSFDRPTDTLLPGQRLVDGQTLYANVSGYNVREGFYAITATATGYNAMERTFPPRRYFQLGSSAASSKSGNYLLFENGSLKFVQVSSPRPLSERVFPPAPSKQFLRLELDGIFRLYQWRINEGGWKKVDQAF